MRKLFVEPTKTTPKISFDAGGVLEIIGESYPENAMLFFKPVFDWLKDFIAETNTGIKFNFKLEYFNTSSSKCILNIMELLEQAYQAGRPVELNWYYKVNDDDILESGQEFAEDISLPFNFLT